MNEASRDRQTAGGRRPGGVAGTRGVSRPQPGAGRSATTSDARRPQARRCGGTGDRRSPPHAQASRLRDDRGGRGCSPRLSGLRSRREAVTIHGHRSLCVWREEAGKRTTSACAPVRGGGRHGAGTWGGAGRTDGDGRTESEDAASSTAGRASTRRIGLRTRAVNGTVSN